MHLESNTNTARFLDMTDRVDVLGSIYRSCESEEDQQQCLDMLLGEYYPSLLHFYADSNKKEGSVRSVQAFIKEKAVDFVTMMEDGTCQDYHYEDMDPLLD